MLPATEADVLSETGSEDGRTLTLDAAEGSTDKASSEQNVLS